MQTPAVNLRAHFGCLLVGSRHRPWTSGVHGDVASGARQAMPTSGVVAQAVLFAGFRFCTWWKYLAAVWMAGDVVCGVVLPASPQDPHPAGGNAAQCTVGSLTGGAGGFIQHSGPVRVVADGDEGPPVDGVAHPFVGGVAEPHLTWPGPAGYARVTGASSFGVLLLGGGWVVFVVFLLSWWGLGVMWIS